MFRYSTPLRTKTNFNAKVEHFAVQLFPVGSWRGTELKHSRGAVRILFYFHHLPCDVRNLLNCSRLNHQALSQQEEGTVVPHSGSCHLMHPKLDSGILVSPPYFPSCRLPSPICTSSGGWILFYPRTSLFPHHIAYVSKIITLSFTLTFPEYLRCLRCAMRWWNKLLLLKIGNFNF